MSNENIRSRFADVYSNKKMSGKPIVVVQGLGFVGIAMAVAVASAKNENDTPYFNVIGIELNNDRGINIINAIKEGRMPVLSNDKDLSFAFDNVCSEGNLTATTDISAYNLADIVIVDIHLDVVHADVPTVDFFNFKSAIQVLGKNMKEGSLIIIETTVPPGTCEHIVKPILEKELDARNLPGDAIFLAHSYERVMPGDNYFNSIVNFWRVYSGATENAANLCKKFLSKIINIKDFPLVQLKSTTASETSKVLENSYRATNIAFIEEWGRFAETVGIDLYEIIEAIRYRPTHNNMRQPGFGVGGYCLTKDPLLAEISAREIFHKVDLNFPFSTMAIHTNNAMPLVSVNKIQQYFKNDLSEKVLLLLGVSYRQDVSDTRTSPSEIFVKSIQKAGVTVLCHDPMVDFWREMDMHPITKLPDLSGIDIVVLSVQHKEYLDIDYPSWLGNYRPFIFDANNVLTLVQRDSLIKIDCPMMSIGRGD